MSPDGGAAEAPAAASAPCPADAGFEGPDTAPEPAGTPAVDLAAAETGAAPSPPAETEGRAGTPGLAASAAVLTDDGPAASDGPRLGAGVGRLDEGSAEGPVEVDGMGFDRFAGCLGSDFLL